MKGIRGSRTRYPVGYANRLLEVTHLLEQKKKLDDVGRELWWWGREVGDRWWRPELVRAAENLDRTLSAGAEDALAGADLGAVFGIELETAEPVPAPRPRRPRAAAGSARPRLPKAKAK